MSKVPRILIVGAAGQVGRELQRSFSGSGELLLWGRDKVDLANPQRVREMVNESRPDLILNAAAYTAVDRAESEPELAMAINCEAPRILAEEAKGREILLVHYSTDYVFDGSKREAWVETDDPNPLNVYGSSKLAGEKALQRVGGKYLIFRTSWVYGPHGNNFLFTMLRLRRERDRLRIVDDQIGAPTSSMEIANATRHIVDAIEAGCHRDAESWAGTYHMSCAGSTSWYGFAGSIFAKMKLAPGDRSATLEPIPSEEYPTPARRPRNSVLSNERLYNAFKVRLPAWEVALESVLNEL